MGIGRAQAKLKNIKRLVYKGKKTSLLIYDKFSKVVLGTAKLWDVSELHPATIGEPNFRFDIAQDTSSCTADNLAKYDLVFNGNIFDVVERSAPLGNAQILWTFLCRPNGQKL